jgi:hypothetical protein
MTTKTTGVLPGTLTALDTANLTVGPFTVPPSGRILVSVSGAEMQHSSSDAFTPDAEIGLLKHLTSTQIGSSHVVGFNIPSVSVTETGFMTQFLCTGLTPGSSLQLDLAGLNTAYSGPSTVYMYGPFTMVVYPA